MMKLVFSSVFLLSSLFLISNERVYSFFAPIPEYLTSDNKITFNKSSDLQCSPYSSFEKNIDQNEIENSQESSDDLQESSIFFISNANTMIKSTIDTTIKTFATRKHKNNDDEYVKKHKINNFEINNKQEQEAAEILVSLMSSKPISPIIEKNNSENLQELPIPIIVGAIKEPIFTNKEIIDQSKIDDFSSTSSSILDKNISNKSDTCDKSFSKRSNLNGHKRIHMDQKSYKCDECDKSFNRSYNLTVHKRSHTGERPFKCTYQDCDGAFITKNHLESHIRNNHTVRSFKCTYKDCIESFETKRRLKKHEGIHTGVKLYKSDTCDKPFANKEISDQSKIDDFSSTLSSTLDKDISMNDIRKLFFKKHNEITQKAAINSKSISTHIE